MQRLFGAKKKEEPKVEPKVEPFDLGQHTAKLDVKTNETDAKLKQLEDEIKLYYQKLKATTITSEKNYIKNRLKNLLMRRKMMENQINRYSNQKMMMDKVQYNHDTVQDTIEMGRYLEQTNKIQQQAMKNIDIDKIQDAMEDMEELAWENDRLAEIMNQNFDVNVDEGLEDELANLENELELQEVMKAQSKDKATYNPLQN